MKHIATLGLALGLALTATLAEAQLSTTTTTIPNTTSTPPAPNSGGLTGSGSTTTLGTTTGLEHSMTGCLQKAASPAGTFIIQNTGGIPRTIGLLNPPSDLSTHLGHKITIKGVAASSAEVQAAPLKPAADHYMKLSTSASALAMVSSTCP